jgi:NADPH:quinone reductase-like Zn-dependent oxidoreductase
MVIGLIRPSKLRRTTNQIKALVYKGINDLGIENVPEPRLESSTDAVVRVTLSAICGSDIHIKHGELPFVKPGTIIGHECCGVIEGVGSDVYYFKKLEHGIGSAKLQITTYELRVLSSKLLATGYKFQV